VLVSGPTLSGCAAARRARSDRRILTVHYHHGTDRASRLKWGAFYRVFGRDYARITFLTDFIRREAEAVAPQLADRFRTVRAPVLPAAPVSPDERAHRREGWGLPVDVPVVVNAGQLIPRKRWDVFLNVAARVARRERDVHFLIAGDGPARPALEARARDLGIAGRVRFVGWQQDTRAVYAAGDVLLFNSDADAFGRTPLEAMACGVPVVASVAYGGTAELIQHERNGFLLDRHEEDALAGHICDVLRASSRRAQIVREGLITVNRDYGYDGFLTTYQKLFGEVLEA
jgi:L-malate glycosyltransferase